MKSSEVSKRYNITLDTLRYYERIGLLPAISRDKSGRRVYSETDIRWVEFIKCMRSIGLSIEVLLDYVNLCNQGESTVAARKEILVEKRDDLIVKIDEMKSILDKLNNKIDTYDKVLYNDEQKLI